jgi:hypothetical protein
MKSSFPRRPFGRHTTGVGVLGWAVFRPEKLSIQSPSALRSLLLRAG